MVYTNPTVSLIDKSPAPWKVLLYLDKGVALFTCTGSPEGVIPANIGSKAFSDNGLEYRKTTDTVNTGWVAQADSVGAAGSTDEAVARFNGVNGALQDSLVFISDAGLLQLGGKTASFPALKRSSTTIQGRDAADGGFVTFQGQNFSAITNFVGVNTSSQLTINGDSGLGRKAAAVIKATDGSTGTGAIVASQLGNEDVSGTDQAGAVTVIAEGKGTGAGAQGRAALKYALTQATGSTVQSLSSNNYPITTLMYSAEQGPSITNTTTETNAVNFTGPPIVGVTTIEAGMMKLGRIFDILLKGRIGITGTPDLTIRIKLGGTTLGTLSPATLLANTTGTWYVFTQLFVRSLGVGGSVGLNPGLFHARTSTGAMFQSDAATVTAIDTTIAQALTITFQWSAASASNTVDVDSLKILIHG